VLKNKYALITGGAHGLGLEFARELVNKYNIIIIGRNKEKLQQAKELLLKHSSCENTSIVTCVFDLSNIESPAAIFEYCQSNNLDVEILINNAGSGVFGELDYLDSQQIIDMLNLNVISLTLLSKLFSAKMKSKNKGYILNIASLAAYQPVPYISPYAASKSYVLNFTEALAKELESFGVRVTCLSPGHTDTGFFQSAGIGNSDEGFYGMNTRISPAKVAEVGLDALFAGKLSVIPGFKNNFLAIINRFSSRNMTANISKKLTQGDWNKKKNS